SERPQPGLFVRAGFFTDSDIPLAWTKPSGSRLPPGRRPVGASGGLVLCGGFGWALRGGGRRLCPPFPIGSAPPRLGYRFRGGGEAAGRLGGRSAVAASGEAGAWGLS